MIFASVAQADKLRPIIKLFAASLAVLDTNHFPVRFSANKHSMEAKRGTEEAHRQGLHTGPSIFIQILMKLILLS